VSARKRRRRFVPFHLRPIGPHTICMNCDLVVSDHLTCRHCGSSNRLMACTDPAGPGYFGCAACNTDRREDHVAAGGAR
jgi:hypothetical protein